MVFRPFTGDSLVTERAQYRLESKLGTGGFGMVFRAVIETIYDEAVFKARILSVGDAVAIKFNRDGKEGLEELKMLRRLECDDCCANATCLFDSAIYDENTGQPIKDVAPGQNTATILVIELLHKSRDLKDVARTLQMLRRSPAATRIKQVYVRNMINAIRVIRRNGIFHRDIKPENFVAGEPRDSTFTYELLEEVWFENVAQRLDPIPDNALARPQPDGPETNLQRLVYLQSISASIDDAQESEFVETYVLFENDPSFAVKAIDFGLAIAIERIEEREAMHKSLVLEQVGTIPFMDPWLVYSIGKGDSDTTALDIYKGTWPNGESVDSGSVFASIDNWALGLTACQLIFGSLPYYDPERAFSSVDPVLSEKAFKRVSYPPTSWGFILGLNDIVATEPSRMGPLVITRDTATDQDNALAETVQPLLQINPSMRMLDLSDLLIEL